MMIHNHTPKPPNKTHTHQCNSHGSKPRILIHQWLKRHPCRPTQRYITHPHHQSRQVGRPQHVHCQCDVGCFSTPSHIDFKYHFVGGVGVDPDIVNLEGGTTKGEIFKVDAADECRFELLEDWLYTCLLRFFIRGGGWVGVERLVGGVLRLRRRCLGWCGCVKVGERMGIELGQSCASQHTLTELATALSR